MKDLANSTIATKAALLAGVLLLPVACSYKKAQEDPAPVATPNTCALPAKVSYKTDVWPILKQNCRDACHNAEKSARFANFDMDNFAQVQYYSTAKPSNQNYSYLDGNIRHEPGYVRMPAGGAKLSDCQIALIEAWIAAGTPNN